MNKYLSSKIKVVSFVCIIMVVFLHCYNFADNFLQSMTTITEGLNYGTFIEFFVCNGFTRVAVPLFFAIFISIGLRRYTPRLRNILTGNRKIVMAEKISH